MIMIIVFFFFFFAGGGVLQQIVVLEASLGFQDLDFLALCVWGLMVSGSGVFGFRVYKVYVPGFNSEGRGVLHCFKNLKALTLVSRYLLLFLSPRSSLSLSL